MRHALALLALAACAAADGPGASTGDPTVATDAGAAGVAVSFPCAHGVYVLSFYDADTARVTVATGNAAAKDVLAGVDSAIAAPQATPAAAADVKVAKTATGWTVSHKAITTTITASAAGLTFAHAHTDAASGKVSTVAEARPLEWAIKATPKASSTTFHVAHDDNTAYYGAGMQRNFNHKGTAFPVIKTEPSNSPFIIYAKHGAGTADRTTAGIFTNTWLQGTYDFTGAGSASLSHGFDKPAGGNVQYVDRFFIFGATAGTNPYRGIMDTFTRLTGRPFMIPLYGLGLGDSNCYHNGRHDNDSRSVLAIADDYNKRGIAAGWILFNDGYGCGIGEGPADFPLDLDVSAEIAQGLNSRGFVAGMWSSTGLKNFSSLVKGGIRVGKTDVAWVGNNDLRYAFDSIQEVATGIEGNSDSRRFMYTCEGWAGTQKNAVMWTGDNTGSWDYESMQLEYYLNSFMSGMAHVSGDLDGIFGGSADGQTYVRDLQMKSMMTAFMTMSGWAANPQKQPYGQPEFVEGVAKAYLDLKVRLTPYQYTLSREAYDTGYPPMRSMLMEFAHTDDDTLYTNNTFTTRQFMSGPSLLVAPIWSSAIERDVYFPQQYLNWYDFWNPNARFTNTGGNTGVKHITAPTTTLPLYVKEDSIIPMYPTGILHPKDVDKEATELELHMWMERDGHSGSFEMYEDDGVTREHENGKFLKTKFAASMADRVITLTISPAVGTPYNGAPKTRKYHIQAHWFPTIDGGDKAYQAKMAGRAAATVGGQPLDLPVYSSLISAEYKAQGTAPAVASQFRTLHVWTGAVPTDAETVVTLNFANP